MRQAIHIFKKDVRRLRYEIGGVLALTLIFAIADMQADRIGIANTLQFVLPVAWWFLIARVIHAEAIPGDHQFWLTRPYDRKSLLTAKALFVLAFINLPILAAQIATLAMNGIPVASWMTGLLWDQVLLTAVVILPAAALAAVTANMVQFGMAALVLVAGAAMDADRDASRGLGPLSWIPDSAAVSAIMLVTVSIVLLQFMRRRTTLSRRLVTGGMALATVGYLLIPWSAAFAVQTWLGAPFRGSVAISFDQNRPPSPYRPGEWRPRGVERVEIPVQASGLDFDRMSRNLMLVTIETPSGVSQPESAHIERFPQGFVAVLLMDNVVFDKVKNLRARLRGNLFLTELSEPQETPLVIEGPPVNVPGVGRCVGLLRRDDIGSNVTCRTAFRWPSLLVVAHVSADQIISFDRGFSYSPFPAELTLSPLVTKEVATYGKTGSQVTILTQKPVSHFRYDFEIPDVRLADYALPSPR